jgi:hypothetical protein
MAGTSSPRMMPFTTSGPFHRSRSQASSVNVTDLMCRIASAKCSYASRAPRKR